MWSSKDHRAWHIIFANLMPSVCILTLLDLTDSGGQLIKSKLNKNKLAAWERLFGQSGLAGVIAIINEKGFLSIERKFLAKKGFIIQESDRDSDWVLQSEFNKKQKILWQKMFDDVPMERIIAVHSNHEKPLRALRNL
ncbi:MAG: hypothetical protein HYW70_01400 [Candidatus Nealsonbacteria bacterium]|nr:hypothetical protein [Candidatus Nealsonbacteria bacterium]